MVLLVPFNPTYAARRQGHEVSSTIFSMKVSSRRVNHGCTHEHAAALLGQQQEARISLCIPRRSDRPAKLPRTAQQHLL